MSRAPATQSEWEAYYRRADRVRAVHGDPFKRHIENVAVKRRFRLVVVALLGLLAVAAVSVGMMAWFDEVKSAGEINSALPAERATVPA
jgi:ferric-dicitrate binding protein FerR (iron transport regulator)